MGAHMLGLLPVALTADLAAHRPHGGEGQDELIRKPGDGQAGNCRWRRLEPVGSGEVIEADGGGEEVSQHDDNREVREFCHEYRSLEAEHREEREGKVDAEYSLVTGENKGHEGEPPLLAGLQLAPGSLVQNLDKSLIPPGALLDELP